MLPKTEQEARRGVKFSNEDLLNVLEKYEIDDLIIAREEAADILNLTKIVEEEEKETETEVVKEVNQILIVSCLLYTSPSPRDS